MMNKSVHALLFYTLFDLLLLQCTQCQDTCWMMFPDADRYGNDIAKIPDISLGECKARCIDMSTCVSLAYSPNWCFLKSGRADLVHSSYVDTYDYICLPDSTFQGRRVSLNNLCPRPLNILVYLPVPPLRVNEVHYDRLHSSSGFSGTETALLEVSHYLATRGHNVTILLEYIHGSLEPKLSSYTTGGVTMHHTSYLRDFDFRPFLDYTDVFTPLSDLYYHVVQRIFDALDPAKVTVWIWFHTVMTLDALLLNINAPPYNHRVLCTFSSDFTRNMYAYPQGKFCAQHTTIGLGVAPHYFNNPDGQEPYVQASRRGRWVFHARHYRGGAFVKRVFEEVGRLRREAAIELHLASYDTSEHELLQAQARNRNRSRSQFQVQTEGRIVSHGSLSKRGLAIVLGNVEYFVYPLVDEEGEVHHDTFGTVVLEALASGVLVVTWDVACLRELYGDLVELVPVTTLSNESYYPTNRRGKNTWMTSAAAVSVLAQALLRLDGDVQEKVRRKTRGMEFARRMTWDVMAPKFAHWLESSV